MEREAAEGSAEEESTNEADAGADTLNDSHNLLTNEAEMCIAAGEVPHDAGVQAVVTAPGAVTEAVVGGGPGPVCEAVVTGARAAAHAANKRERDKATMEKQAAALHQQRDEKRAVGMRNRLL